MMTRVMACVPLRVWFQSTPAFFRKKATMPTVGLNRKNHRTPATTGATA